MKIILAQLCSLVLCCSLHAPFANAHGQLAASPPPLWGDALLEDLNDSGADWRTRVMLISVHEQMFRTGRRIVYEPYWFWSINVLGDDRRSRARVMQETIGKAEPLSQSERLAHFHEAMRLHNQDWSVFRLDKEEGSEMLLITSMSLAKLYDHGAPYVLDVQITHGLFYDRTQLSSAEQFDLIALYRIDSMRILAEKAIDKLWDSDLVAIAKLCSEDDGEGLTNLLRDAAAINSLEEASDMYASVVLVGDRLMNSLADPWKSPYWGITRQAAGLWFALEERRRLIDEAYKGPDREISAKMKKWRDAQAPSPEGR